MSIVIGVNSWATIAEADEYLTTKVGSGPWFGLIDSPASPGDPSKESYLIMAFETLVYKPGYNLAPDNTDDNLKKAQIELAYYFVGNYAQFVEQSDMANRGLSSFTLSKWSESFFNSWEGDFPLPYMVSKFIGSYRMDNTTVDVDPE